MDTRAGVRRQAAVPGVAAGWRAVLDDPRAALPRDPGLTFATLLAGGREPRPRGPAAIAGVEQEYDVLVDGEPVDFSDLADRAAPASGIRRFAFDPDARIVRSGAVWTVDAPQAEIATPPRDLGPGVAGRVADDALAERDALLRRLRGMDRTRTVALRGYSTHINAFADGVDGWALADRIALTYAPTLMLLCDRRASPGLLVRPRPERMELGTEFLDTRDDLIAAIVVSLAAVIAAWRACAGIDDTTPGGPAPAPLDASAFRQTWQRPGWFVARDAFGDDLYARGREARLRTAAGGTEVAGDRLLRTWAHLRPIAAGFATAEELSHVDDRVRGDALLPMERADASDERVRLQHRPPRPAPTPQARLLSIRRRPGVRVEPEAVTWEQSVLRVRHPVRDVFVAVPRDASERFIALWTGGALDGPLAAFAADAPAGRIARLDDVRAGLFDAVESPDRAAERLGRVKRDGRKSTGRRPKRRLGPALVPTDLVPRSVTVPPPPPGATPAGSPPISPPPPAPPPPWPTPRTWITVIVIIVVVVTTVIISRIPGGSPPTVVQSPPAETASPPASGGAPPTQPTGGSSPTGHAPPTQPIGGPGPTAATPTQPIGGPSPTAARSARPPQPPGAPSPSPHATQPTRTPSRRRRPGRRPSRRPGRPPGRPPGPHPGRHPGRLRRPRHSPRRQRRRAGRR